MTPAQIASLMPRLWQAETIKLHSRLTVKIALVVSLAIGFLGPLVLFALGHSGVEANGQGMAERLTLTAPMATQWALELRNFLVLRFFIVGVGALILASEYQARTLREDLLRPVPRWTVLIAKWLAMCTFITLTAVSTWLVSVVLGVILFDFSGDWTSPVLGYLTTLPTDFGFAALVLFISVILRSVIGTAIGVLLYAIFDTLLGWSLALLKMVDEAFGTYIEIPMIEWIVLIDPWLPSAAYEAWRGFYPGAEWEWQSWVSLVVLTCLTLGGGAALFEKIDVN